MLRYGFSLGVNVTREMTHRRRMVVIQERLEPSDFGHFRRTTVVSN